jgi:RNA polymerase-binding transcription factor DksA
MWTANEQAEIRARLESELREIDRSRAGLADGEPRDPAETEEPERPVHSEDLATRQAGEEVALGLLSVEGQLRADILDALARLDRNRYGVCERCGKGVTKERLRAHPSARFCLPCAREGNPPADGRAGW